ncbi:hypothetical protein [Sphingobacterium sp. ML3W]|nr:hypothetical protein [Sphingobacterium sp. ML3W]
MSNAVTISLIYSPHNLITLKNLITIKNDERPVIGLPKPADGGESEG